MVRKVCCAIVIVISVCVLANAGWSQAPVEPAPVQSLELRVKTLERFSRDLEAFAARNIKALGERVYVLEAEKGKLMACPGCDEEKIKEAMTAGKISEGMAALIAKMPAELQPEAQKLHQRILNLERTAVLLSQKMLADRAQPAGQLQEVKP